MDIYGNKADTTMFAFVGWQDYNTTNVKFYFLPLSAQLKHQILFIFSPDRLIFNPYIVDCCDVGEKASLAHQPTDS